MAGKRGSGHSGGSYTSDPMYSTRRGSGAAALTSWGNADNTLTNNNNKVVKRYVNGEDEIGRAIDAGRPLTKAQMAQTVNYKSTGDTAPAANVARYVAQRKRARAKGY